MTGNVTIGMASSVSSSSTYRLSGLRKRDMHSAYTSLRRMTEHNDEAIVLTDAEISSCSHVGVKYSRLRASCTNRT